MPLVPGQANTTDTGIHNLRAVPRDDGGFELYWNLGWAPVEIPYHPEPEHDPVDHAFFLRRYEIANRVGSFNSTLLVMRRSRDSIVTFRRGKKLLRTDAGIETVETSEAQWKTVLIEEFGFSEEIVAMIPPDADAKTVY
jgi:hypothetical protein